jgi:hypothetical protein
MISPQWFIKKKDDQCMVHHVQMAIQNILENL